MKTTIRFLLSFFALGAFASAADSSHLEMANGTTIDFNSSTGVYTVKDSAGHVQTYPSGTYRQLLQSSAYGSGASDADVRRASNFVIDTSVPTPQEAAHSQDTIVVEIPDEFYDRLTKSNDGHIVLDQDTVKKAIDASTKAGMHTYYANKQGLVPLQQKSTAKHYNIEEYAYAGPGTSMRKGAKQWGVGYRVNNWGMEYSCDDEGKQPYGITNVNRICNYDIQKVFPITDKFEVFVEGGVTAQRGHKGPWWTRYHNPQGYDDCGGSWNVGYGAELETPVKRIWIRVESKTAHYCQLDIPKPETMGSPSIHGLLSAVELTYKVRFGRNSGGGSSAAQ